jgi:hypothetical protein
MGTTLGTLAIGGCTLLWERQKATLSGKAGKAPLEVNLTDGSIREKPLAKGSDQAVLDSGTNAVLADGARYSLRLVMHGEPVLAALIAGGRALLVAREDMGLYDFETGSVITHEPTAGGALQHELAVSRDDLAAVPGQRQVFIVDAAAGRIRVVWLDERVASVAIAAGQVTVKSGKKTVTVFDRAGNRVG